MPTVSEFLSRLMDEAGPHIEQVSVPIFGIQDDTLKRDRTGVLYRLADHHFILTAAHDLGEIISAGIPLYVPQVGGEDPLVPLTAAVFRLTEEDGRDIAVIELDDRTVDALASHRKFLTHAEIDIADQGKGGLYLICGYPQDKEWFGITDGGDLFAHPLLYMCQPHSGEMMSGSRYDPRVHLALEFHQKALRTDDLKSRTLPELHGISGCGVWRVADCSAEGITNWSPREVRLVGLQHRWSRTCQYIMGTWIRYAMDTITRYHPDLGPAMGLVYPRR